MIAFDLQCNNGHVFEGWFKNENAFKDQKRKGLVVCPFCEDKNVVKILSSFGIVKSSGKPVASDGADAMLAMQELGKKVYDFIETNFDNVGADFAREALRIHYGVSEPRNIRGVSTEKEEKMLKEEGIDIVKIPIPEDKAQKNDTDA